MAAPKIIGFAGLAGAGKDTAGAVFVERGYSRVSLAQPMKSMLSRLLRDRGVAKRDVGKYTDGALKDVPTDYLMGRTPRHALQTLGYEWGRKLMDNELWIDTLKRRIRRSGQAVVTDVRFADECEAIRDLGGQVFRIVRPFQMVGGDTHPTEAACFSLPVDGEIINDFAGVEAFQADIAARFF